MIIILKRNNLLSLKVTKLSQYKYLDKENIDIESVPIEVIIGIRWQINVHIGKIDNEKCIGIYFNAQSINKL